MHINTWNEKETHMEHHGKMYIYIQIQVSKINAEFYTITTLCIIYTLHVHRVRNITCNVHWLTCAPRPFCGNAQRRRWAAGTAHALAAQRCRRDRRCACRVPSKYSLLCDCFVMRIATYLIASMYIQCIHDFAYHAMFGPNTYSYCTRTCTNVWLQ